MKSRVLILLILLITVGAVYSQGYQRSRKSVQKARFSHRTKRYGQACEIFAKKRIKGEKKPILNLGFGRKRKPKMAEQN